VEFLQVVILGIAQGITEFLPVSSSAHLVLIPYLLGWKHLGLSFDVALHAGTLMAIAMVFRGEWMLIVSGLWRWLKGERDNPSARLAFQIAVATVPAALVGVLLGHQIEQELRNPTIIVFTTLGFGLLMGWADQRGTQVRTLQDLGWGDVLFVGLLQALALVPGVSRSGITITAAIFRRVDRASAARFSFLIGGPITAGAVLLQFVKLFQAWRGQVAEPDTLVMLGGFGFVLMIVGIITSAVVGFLCIRFLLVYLQQRTLRPFVLYRVALAVVLGAALWL